MNNNSFVKVFFILIQLKTNLNLRNVFLIKRVHPLMF